MRTVLSERMVAGRVELEHVLMKQDSVEEAELAGSQGRSKRTRWRRKKSRSVDALDGWVKCDRLQTRSRGHCDQAGQLVVKNTVVRTLENEYHCCSLRGVEAQADWGSETALEAERVEVPAELAVVAERRWLVEQLFELDAVDEQERDVLAGEEWTESPCR